MGQIPFCIIPNLEKLLNRSAEAHWVQISILSLSRWNWAWIWITNSIKNCLKYLPPNNNNNNNNDNLRPNFLSRKRIGNKFKKSWGSGCGSVGEAIASDARGMWFESCILPIYCQLNWKDENNEKEVENGSIKKVFKSLTTSATRWLDVFHYLVFHSNKICIIA